MPSLNSIGSQVFQFLSLPPDWVRSMLQVEARAGVDGVTIWDTGQRAEPFVVTAMVDLANLSAVIAKQREYDAYVSSGPVPVIWGGVPTVDVVVIRVRTLEAKQVLSAVGGLQAGNAILRTEWTLQPV